MINNRNFRDNQKRPTVKKHIIYAAAEDNNKFSHHASLAYFKGKFYAMWSSGAENEDDVGQYVMMSVSEDGEHWSDGKPLFAPIEGNSVLTSAGWLVRDDGVLNAYAGLWYYSSAKREEGDHGHIATTLLCKTSEDGECWSENIDLGLSIVPNQGPHKLSNGRLVICGNVSFPYTDAKNGIDGWKTVGLSPWPVEGIADDSEGICKHAKHRSDDFNACEGSFFEMRDGKIAMLLRNTVYPATPENRYLLISESNDFGESYSAPVQTDLTNNNSKFYCMRLSNGKFAMICNPDKKGNRIPLSILISDDGENFNREYIVADEPVNRKFAGLYKSGIYGYPHAVEANGRLYVICTINKEDVSLFLIDIADLK